MRLGESLNSAFDRVYVLSLRASVERRDHIKKECEKINLQYRFFDAYDGIKLFKSVSEGSIIGERYCSYPSNVRYYAAQISSDVMVMEAMNDDLKNFILLNDDIYWDNYANFTADNFLDIKRKIPEFWDIIILGSISTLHPYLGGVDYHLATDNFSGCHGIAINNTLYEDWLKFSALKTHVGDGFIEFLYRHHNKIIYRITPDICLQDRTIPSTATKLDI